MTNTTHTAAYSVDLTVDTSFSAFTIGQMIADAMATMPDDTFDFSFDPYWDGTPRVILPLVYRAPGLNDTQVGTLTITAPGTVECFAPGCTEIFFTKEDMLQHARSHVEHLTLVEPPC